MLHAYYATYGTVCDEGDAQYLEEWDIDTDNELEGNFPFLNQDEETIAGEEAEETRRLLTDYVAHIV